MSLPNAPAFMFRDDHAYLAKTAQSASGSITTCFLFTRLWARTTRYKGLWWDDYILIAAWALLLCGNGLEASSPSYGFNVLQGEGIGFTVHMSSVCFMYVAIALSKTAFATTLLRLTSSSPAKALLYVIIFVVNAFAIVMVIVSFLDVCNSRFKFASLPTPCITMTTIVWIHMGNAICSLLADLILTVYPWTMVNSSRIRMSSREKRLVASTMSLVGLSGIMCIAKLTVQALMPSEEYGDLDWTYGAVLCVALHQAEAALMIIAQTFPVLRVLLQAGSAEGSRTGLPREASKRGNPPGVGITTNITGGTHASIELVQLPTGRIVTAEGAQRLGQTQGTSEQSQPAQQTAPPDSAEHTEAETQAQTTVNIMDDEIHRMWSDMGLSRRAWSQSPSPAPEPALESSVELRSRIGV